MLSASIASLNVSQNVAIQGVSATVWSAANPTQFNPVADGLVGTSRNATGLRFNVGVSNNDTSAWTLKYAWKVVGTNATGNGEAAGSGGASVGFNVATLPAVGKFTLDIDVSLLDAAGKPLGTARSIEPTLYVTYSDPKSGTPTLNYINKATDWAEGGPGDSLATAPDDVLANLNRGIFHKSGWKYRDLTTLSSELLTGKLDQGNCWSFANVFNDLGRVLGFDTKMSRTVYGKTEWAQFVTKPGVTMDGQTGNARQPGGPLDRWIFVLHQTAEFNGKYYDPSFARVYTGPTDFVEWWLKPGNTQSLNGEVTTRTLRSTLPMGEWEYRTRTQAPFNGAAVPSLPGKVQIEDFDLGGAGVGYQDADNANRGGAYRTGDGVDIETVAGGSNVVNFTQAGEWLEYTVDVAAAGRYDLNFRVASEGAGGKFHLDLDGKNLSGAMTVPDTGGWGTWKTVTRRAVTLPAGRHVFRLAFDSVGESGFAGNFNYFTFTPRVAGTGATPPPPSLSIGNAVVTEGDSGTKSAAFRVTLSKPATRTVTVTYTTSPGTATTADFKPLTGTLTFAPGQTAKTFSIKVIGDLKDENDETFAVRLSAPTGTTAITRPRGIATIRDND